MNRFIKCLKFHYKRYKCWKAKPKGKRTLILQFMGSPKKFPIWLKRLKKGKNFNSRRYKRNRVFI